MRSRWIWATAAVAAAVGFATALVAVDRGPGVAAPAPTTAVYSATIATYEATSSAAFGDLATPGPAVSVRIGPSGRALVILSALMATPNKSAAMSFEVTGASHLAPALSRSLALAESEYNVGVSIGAGLSRVVVVGGLMAGTNVFTAKYMQVGGTTPMGFQDRSITVLVF